jgi:uncharacterized membrane protein YozB (DUF420 family)
VDPKLSFWTLALANMAVIVALAARGVRAVRAGDVARHRRSMLLAGGLIVAFLAAYVGKRLLLGGEELAAWSLAARVNLWVHESLVALMLVAGAGALLLGRRLSSTRRVSGRPDAPLPSPAMLRRHRRLGWTAVVASGLGFATACGILAGMFSRA